MLFLISHRLVFFVIEPVLGLVEMGMVSSGSPTVDLSIVSPLFYFLINAYFHNICDYVPKG